MKQKLSADQILDQYYSMLYPQQLRDDEYVRLVAIHKNVDGTSDVFVRFVRSCEEFKVFVAKYKYGYDLYAQAATNRGDSAGTKSSQWRRRVLFLDFDKKDHPKMTTAKDCMDYVHERLPRLFAHCIVDSGHGFHCYICIPETDQISNVISVNKLAAEITEADPKAVSPSQLCRIPCSFNHKITGGSDYSHMELWKYVAVVNNVYGSPRFRTLGLGYVRRMCESFLDEPAQQDEAEKVIWHYETLADAPKYLCIRRAMAEGVDEGQRNFWHGRIVAMLRQEGYLEESIYRECHAYNSRCRPPKSADEIDKDTERFLQSDYRLLGCYEAFDEADPRREWVYEMCDKAHCRTYHSGMTVTVTGKRARLNNKVLDNKTLRKLSGRHFLVLTLLEVYADAYGRKGFRVRDLEKLLPSSVAAKQCIAYRGLKSLLAELCELGYVTMVPDGKQPDSYRDIKLKLSRRLEEFQKGYIEFYFSIASAMIDGKISAADYRVYITLVRNLSFGKPVTYEQLADDLDMDPSHVGKSIRRLRDERCLIVKKRYTEKGYEYNHYQLLNPDLVWREGPLADSADEVITLLS